MNALLLFWCSALHDPEEECQGAFEKRRQGGPIVVCRAELDLEENNMVAPATTILKFRVFRLFVSLPV